MIGGLLEMEAKIKKEKKSQSSKKYKIEPF